MQAFTFYSWMPTYLIGNVDDSFCHLYVTEVVKTVKEFAWKDFRLFLLMMAIASYVYFVCFSSKASLWA